MKMGRKLKYVPSKIFKPKFLLYFKGLINPNLSLDVLGLNVKFVTKNIFLYRKIASSNTSCSEAHAGFFRLLMKGIFYPYVL